MPGPGPRTEEPAVSGGTPEPADDKDEKADAPPVSTEAPAPSDRRARQAEAEFDVSRVRLPNKKLGELFGIADQLLGASRIRVACQDGKARMARIPGKLRKRMWIREGDLVIIRPWEFQNDKSDVLWRYTKTQASYLSRRKMLPSSIDVF